MMSPLPKRSLWLAALEAGRRAFLGAERGFERRGIAHEARLPRISSGLMALQPAEAGLPAGGVARGRAGRQLVEQDEERPLPQGRELVSQRVLAAAERKQVPRVDLDLLACK